MSETTAAPTTNVVAPDVSSSPAIEPAKPTKDTSGKEEPKSEFSKDQFLNVLLLLLIVILIYFAVKKYRKSRSGYNKGNESERDDPGGDFNIQELIKTIKQKQEQIIKSLS